MLFAIRGRGGGPELGRKLSNFQLPAKHVHGAVGFSIRPAMRASPFPTIDDGVKRLTLIEAAVRSSQANGAWTKI